MKKDLKNKKTPVRSEISKWLFRLGLPAIVIAKVMMLIGCPSPSGGNGTTYPTLQDAINWANLPERRWAQADNVNNKLPFAVADSDIRGDRTFTQLAIDALTEAWNATYSATPALWTPEKWKEIIGNAPNRDNSWFCDLGELPLTISKGGKTFNNANPMGSYMLAQKKQRAV